MSGLRRHVICVDESNGKIRWDRSNDSNLPEEPMRGIGLPHHGYATNTPVADG